MSDTLKEMFRIERSNERVSFICYEGGLCRFANFFEIATSPTPKDLSFWRFENGKMYIQLQVDSTKHELSEDIVVAYNAWLARKVVE